MYEATEKDRDFDIMPNKEYLQGDKANDCKMVQVKPRLRNMESTWRQRKTVSENK